MGDSYENWELFCDKYISYFDRQRVTVKERLELFPIALGGTAKQFFIQDVQPKSRTKKQGLKWGEIVAKFNNRFASSVKKRRMSAHLATLRIYQFDDNSRDSASSLEKLIANIDKIAPMSRTGDRTDEARGTFLKNADRSCTVAFPIKMCIPHPLRESRHPEAMVTDIGREDGSPRAVSLRDYLKNNQDTAPNTAESKEAIRPSLHSSPIPFPITTHSLPSNHPASNARGKAVC